MLQGLVSQNLENMVQIAQRGAADPDRVWILKKAEWNLTGLLLECESRNIQGGSLPILRKAFNWPTYSVT